MGADGHMQGKLKDRDVWAVLDAKKKDLIHGSKQKLTVLRVKKGKSHVCSSEFQSTYPTFFAIVSRN